MLFALAALGAAPAGASAACAGADVQVTDVAAAEHTMLCLLNEYRGSRGAPPLILDVRLARAARAHADDMVARRYFDHYSPEGLGPSERARKQGFPSGAGENIAYSSDVTPQSIFELWRTSPGHDRNMLDRSYNVVGIGFALGMPRADGGPGSPGATGVQDFGDVEVPAGSDTGLGAAPAPGPAAAPAAAPGPAPACRAATPSVTALTGLLQARRRQLSAALARARAQAARVRATRGHRARAREQRRLRAGHLSLTRARQAVNASRHALAAARTRATRACAGS
ncbi:MAG: hypothetical protein QOI91_1770 [Solirubrobacteraceae bacterium]|jgi:hypothetical protein|nr:hypothetical protein [Solirubrobacteraceae bacterium]